MSNSEILVKETLDQVDKYDFIEPKIRPIALELVKELCIENKGKLPSSITSSTKDPKHIAHYFGSVLLFLFMKPKSPTEVNQEFDKFSDLRLHIKSIKKILNDPIISHYFSASDALHIRDNAATSLERVLIFFNNFGQHETASELYGQKIDGKKFVIQLFADDLLTLNHSFLGDVKAELAKKIIRSNTIESLGFGQLSESAIGERAKIIREKMKSPV